MLPAERFDKMFDAGVRAQYMASLFAVPHMIEAGKGLIVNLSFWGGGTLRQGGLPTAWRGGDE